MRALRLLFTMVCVLAIAFSCSPTSDQENDPTPDYSNQITGTYNFTTSENGSVTGSGKAIIAKETNSSIRIGLEDGVSFIATNLQRVDNDMVMEVPNQAIKHYGIDSQYAGTRTISRAGSTHHGVYFGSTGELRMGLQITIGSTKDQVLLVLKR